MLTRTLALWAIVAAMVATLTTDAMPRELIPCPSEDSGVSCYWNAETMGNGHGQSFTVDAHGIVTYTD